MPNTISIVSFVHLQSQMIEVFQQAKSQWSSTKRQCCIGCMWFQYGIGQNWIGKMCCRFVASTCVQWIFYGGSGLMFIGCSDLCFSLVDDYQTAKTTFFGEGVHTGRNLWICMRDFVLRGQHKSSIYITESV